MDVQNDIPNVRYLWQRPYLAAALETDTRQLPDKISEARHAIRGRKFDGVPLDAHEQLAIADALSALATLEKERLNLDLDADKRIVVLDLTAAGSKSNAAS